MTAIPIDDRDLKFIDTVLYHYQSGESIRNCSELDGFLTGVISSPVKLEVQQWMWAIWGGAEGVPQWEDSDETKLFTGLIFVIMSQTAAMLKRHSDQFEPMFISLETTDQPVTRVQDWCCGYMRAVALRPEAWQNLPELAATELKRIDEAARYPTGLDQPQAMPAKLSPKRIEMAVLQLYAHWRRQGQLQPLPRPPQGSTGPIKVPEQNKVNRNAPCPCGSGKKYKKCCGG